MTALTFAVRRSEAVLVGPATPTPRETKRLSDIDSEEVLRVYAPFVFFYRGGKGLCDPASVIRRALGEALVAYYPMAGRLREVEGRKLVVDCTGEGVLFVEGDADVLLGELEAAGLSSPFPCLDQLIFDVERSSGLLNCPLLLVQVTRLLCGGFVFAFRINHAICDAIGLANFISAVAELARGVPTLTTKPVWCRELLEARRPPETTFPHRDHDAVPMPPPGDMVVRTFTFGPAEFTAIKKGLPPNLRETATSFEAVTGALWRARTAALELPPDDEVRLAIIVNFRRLTELALPAGYYGNAVLPSVVPTTAGSLVAGGSSLGDAVEMVRKAKAAVTAEYVLSSLGQPYVAHVNTFVVTDHRHAGFHRVDFGWGEPLYGGIAEGAFFGVSSLVSLKDAHGEDAIGFVIALPRPAMDRFAAELEMLVTPLPAGQASPAARARL